MRCKSWLNCAIANSFGPFELLDQSQHQVMLAQSLGDRQRQVGFEQIQIDARLLGFGQRLLSLLLSHRHNYRPLSGPRQSGIAKAEAKIDTFATSLPTMLLFADDLLARQLTTAKFLEAQARLGLGEKKRAAALLSEVLRRDPNHPLAADLASP